MFGFISKKKLIQKMKSIKDSNRKENIYAKFPPETERQEKLNIYSSGYEDGTDNFYNCIKSFIENN